MRPTPDKSAKPTPGKNATPSASTPGQNAIPTSDKNATPINFTPSEYKNDKNATPCEPIGYKNPRDDKNTTISAYKKALEEVMMIEDF